jgi:hypothetical protein
MDPINQYFEDVYRLRDEAFKAQFPEELDPELKKMFDAGFDAMLEIIEHEIAIDERAEIKLTNDKLV